MKRLMIGIVIAAVVVLCGSAAFADDTKVSLGLKGWINSWERSDSFGNSVESDSAIFMVGPSLNIKNGPVFFGGSILVSTSPYKFTSGANVDEIDRTDIDLMIGYMFNPYIGGFLGYKSISADVTNKSGSATVGTWTFTMTGPGIGLVGNIPLGESGAALYGSLSYMALSYEEDFEGSTYSEDEPGASIEVGVAFGMTEQLSGSIGIKSQSFTGSDSDIQDTFAGLTLGINYTF